MKQLSTLEGEGGDIGHDSHPGKVDVLAIVFVGHMDGSEKQRRGEKKGPP